MRTELLSSSGGRWHWWIIAGLLICLACWSMPGAISKEKDIQGIRKDRAEGWAKVTWAQGRLSVDAKEASIQMILHRIGEQAGFSLNLGPIGRRTISVQLTDVELEQGLRRLLQLASLSYAMQRAPRAGGGVVLTKLWVFSEGQEDPRSHSENVTRNDEATTHDTQQIQEAALTTTSFVEFFQQAQQPQADQQVPQTSLTPQPAALTTTSFVEFFQQAQQPQAGQQVPQTSLMSQPAASTPTNPFVEFFQRMQ